MPSRRHQHPTRGRQKLRSKNDGRYRRSTSRDNDDETGNDTFVEHSTDSSDYDSEVDYVSIKPRSVRKKTFCLCCTKERAKLFHETLRDVVIIVIMIFLILSTMKQNQKDAISSAIVQLSNFTGLISQQLYPHERPHRQFKKDSQ
jgi:hypothetical protein